MVGVLLGGVVLSVLADEVGAQTVTFEGRCDEPAAHDSTSTRCTVTWTPDQAENYDLSASFDGNAFASTSGLDATSWSFDAAAATFGGEIVVRLTGHFPRGGAVSLGSHAIAVPGAPAAPTTTVAATTTTTVPDSIRCVNTAGYALFQSDPPGVTLLASDITLARNRIWRGEFYGDSASTWAVTVDDNRPAAATVAASVSSTSDANLYELVIQSTGAAGEVDITVMDTSGNSPTKTRTVTITGTDAAPPDYDVEVIVDFECAGFGRIDGRLKLIAAMLVLLNVFTLAMLVRPAVRKAFL